MLQCLQTSSVPLSVYVYMLFFCSMHGSEESRHREPHGPSVGGQGEEPRKEKQDNLKGNYGFESLSAVGFGFTAWRLP